MELHTGGDTEFSEGLIPWLFAHGTNQLWLILYQISVPVQA